MKTLFVTFLTVLSFNALAAENLFHALNVKPVTLASDNTSDKVLKSVGGLSCTKTSSFRSGKRYECEFDFKALNSALIYKSLKAVESSRPSPRTELRLEKTVGNLSCTKVDSIQKGVNFNCTLKTSNVKGQAEPRE